MEVKRIIRQGSIKEVIGEETNEVRTVLRGKPRRSRSRQQRSLQWDPGGVIDGKLEANQCIWHDRQGNASGHQES